MTYYSRVVETPISVLDCERRVADASAGAVVGFGGVVRDHDDGRAVTKLHYEGHPEAARILEQVASEAASDPAIMSVAVEHRVGDLEIGDVALAAAVSAAHRGEAFAACAKLVDEVKARLPIWKHQFFADGSTEWVNCP